MSRVFFALFLSGCVSYGNPLIRDDFYHALDVKKCVDKIEATAKTKTAPKVHIPRLPLYQQCDASLRAQSAFWQGIVGTAIAIGGYLLIKSAMGDKKDGEDEDSYRGY